MPRDSIRFPLLVRSLILVIFFLVLFSLLSAVYAQGSLIAFLDERDLDVKWSILKDKPTHYTIEILNLYGLDQEIQLRVVGLIGPGGETLPDNLLVVEPAKTVGARRSATWTLQANPGMTPLNGAYEGYLVATGQMTGMARRRLLLQIDSGLTPTPIVVTPSPLPPLGLTPGITNTVTIVGTNYFSSLFSPWLPTLVTLLLIGVGGFLVWWRLLRRQATAPTPDQPTQPPSQQAIIWLIRLASIVALLVIVGVVRAGADMFVDAAKRCFIATPQWPGYEACTRVASHVLDMRLIRASSVPVAGAEGITLVNLASATDGSLAQLALHQGRLTVVDAPRAGKYEGRIDVLPNDASKGLVQVTANIADWWVWAFVAIASGVVLGYAVTNYARTGRQSELLRLRSAQLVARIVDDQRVFHQNHPEDIFANLTLRGLALEWQNEFLNTLDKSRGEEDLKPLRETLDKLGELFAEFKDYRNQVLELDDTRDKVASMARQLLREPSFGAYNVFRLTQNAITQKPIAYTSLKNAATALEARRKEVEGLIAWLHSLAGVLAHALILMEDVENLIPAAKRGEYRKRLKLVAVAALSADKTEDLAAQEDEADKLASEIHKPQVGPGMPETPADQPRDRRQTIPGRWGLGRRQPSPTPEARQARRLQQLFDRNELQMTLLTGLLTVGLGLYNLYYKNPAWGTPADYLYAVLWGSAVSEGLKYIGHMVNRLWTTSS